MENEQNGFCPECGALMRDGICQSCGNAPGQETMNQVAAQEAVNVQPVEQPVYQTGVEEGEERYYTPLVTPPPATDLRAMKEQRRPQNGPMPPNGQPMYSAPGQMPPNIPYNYGGGNGMPPTGMPPMNNGIPMGAVPPQDNQKKNSNIAIIIVCIIAVLVAVFVVVAGIFVQRSFKQFREEMKQLQEDKRYAGDWEYGDDWEYDDDYDPYEESDDGLYGSTPDATYYEGLTDSINYDVNYDITFEEYMPVEEDYLETLDYQVYYVLLEGEQIPNLEKINAQLEYYSKWYVDDVAREQAENGVECFISSYAYVTYNDEQKVSIVLSETAQIGDEYYVELYPINIDLVNGTILKNTEMIQIDAEFVRDFRERSEKQNGEALPEFTDEQIYNHMMDEDSLIVFYTPVGLEVGINYEGVYGSGWVTVTYKDYQNLLSLSG